MKQPLLWIHGDDSLRTHINEWWRNDDTQPSHLHVIARSKHRRVLRLDRPHDQSLLVKHFESSRHQTPLVNLIKRLLKREPWRREWRSLRTLRNSTSLAPKPLGLARTSTGDVLLVSQFIHAPSLGSQLAEAKPDTHQLASDCGGAIFNLHEAGVAHGDLHPGNILLTPSGPLFIDFQRGQKLRHRRRISDLARLDFSLELEGLPHEERKELISRALPHPLMTPEHDSLIQKKSRQLARQHQRTRIRQSVRVGHGREPLDSKSGRGLRRTDLTQSDMQSAFKSHLASSADKRKAHFLNPITTSVTVNGRALRIHEQRLTNLRSRLHMTIVGSPARRAWKASHDPCPSEGHPRVLAFREQHRHGLLISCEWITESSRSDSS